MSGDLGLMAYMLGVGAQVLGVQGLSLKVPTLNLRPQTLFKNILLGRGLGCRGNLFGLSSYFLLVKAFNLVGISFKLTLLGLGLQGLRVLGFRALGFQGLGHRFQGAEQFQGLGLQGFRAQGLKVLGLGQFLPVQQCLHGVCVLKTL